MKKPTVLKNKKCKRCKTTKTTNYFYKNKYTKDGYDHWCKNCRKDVVVDYETLAKYLKINEKPFYSPTWDRAMEEAKDFADENLEGKGLSDDELFARINEKAVSNYFRYTNLPNFAPDSFHEDDVKVSEDYIPEYLVIKWGEGYSLTDYKKLEEYEKNMKNDYNIVTTSHKDYLKKIAKISLKMDIAIDKNDFATVKNLSGQYDSLMKSAKFTAVQRTQADETGGLNTFSDFFRLIEEEGFIPVFPSENRDIVDETILYMEDYLKKLVLNDPSIMTDVELSIEALDIASCDDNEGVENE